MKKFYKTLLCIFLFLCLAIPSISYADNSDIIMKGQVGFEGYFKLTEWIPITVDIENKGSDINGRIEVVTSQDTYSSVLFTTPVVIPQNSQKRVNLYVKINTLQKKLDIKLTSKDKTIKTVIVDNLIPMPVNKYLIGVLTDDPNGLNYWWEKQSSGRLFSNYEAVALKADDVSDKKEVLDNFTILIVNNFDTTTLSEAQVKNMTNWVEGGGILIVGTGANGARVLNGMYSDLMKIKDSGTAALAGSPMLEQISGNKIFADIPIDILKLDYDNASTASIASEGSNVLVLKEQKGNGYIFTAAFDLGIQPIPSWAGNKTFWENIFVEHINPQKLSFIRNPEFSRDIEANRNPRILDALANIKAMDPPSSSNLLIILFLYLIVMGPINYFVLKKLDKREWIWVTIPILVVAFSLSIYGLGYTIKGNEPILNTISIADISGSSGYANIDTYTGIFIPKRGDYTFGVDNNLLLSTTTGQNRYDMNPDDGGGKGNIQFEVSQGNSSYIKVYGANMWTMQTFLTRKTVDNFGAIEGRLNYQSGSIKGSIINNTQYPLEDVVILSDLGYYKVGNIAAGAEKSIDFKTINSGMQRNDPYTVIHDMLNSIYPDSAMTQGKPDDDKRDQVIKRRILESMMDYNKPVNINNTSTNVQIFGFTNQKLSDDIKINNKDTKKAYHKNLILAQLKIDIEQDGKISIPAGMIKATADKTQSSNINLDHDLIYIPTNDQVTFYFDMNDYKDVNIEKLTISIMVNRFKGRFEGQDGEIYVYDVSKGDFTDQGDGLTIDGQAGIINIDPNRLEKYIDDAGKLSIRIKSLGQDGVEASIPSLELEGRRK